MYAWIWRRLPGGVPGKLFGVMVLLAASVALLFLVIFPWAGPKLPFNHVTVDGSTPQNSQTQQPAATASAVPD